MLNILRILNAMYIMNISIERRVQRMEKDEMINLLTEYATNERLDSLVLQNTEYVSIRKKTTSIMEELEKLDSSKEIQKLIDRYDSATYEAAALYANFAYKQGLKDMFNLVISLKDKKEDIEI